jgi:hypothetical protein
MFITQYIRPNGSSFEFNKITKAFFLRVHEESAIEARIHMISKEVE